MGDGCPTRINPSLTGPIWGPSISDAPRTGSRSSASFRKNVLVGASGGRGTQNVAELAATRPRQSQRPLGSSAGRGSGDRRPTVGPKRSKERVGPVQGSRHISFRARARRRPICSPGAHQSQSRVASTCCRRSKRGQASKAGSRSRAGESAPGVAAGMCLLWDGGTHASFDASILGSRLHGPTRKRRATIVRAATRAVLNEGGFATEEVLTPMARPGFRCGLGGRPGPDFGALSARGRHPRSGNQGDDSGRGFEEN